MFNLRMFVKNFKILVQRAPGLGNIDGPAGLFLPTNQLCLSRGGRVYPRGGFKDYRFIFLQKVNYTKIEFGDFEQILDT